MGLFNFFKKGSATEDVGGLEVKGTAYDTTAKALPPIRGTLPVQGNGPNTLDELQRSARLRSGAGLTSNHSPAPSNRVSRLRSMSLGRPSTAPGGGSLPGSDPNSRPKSSSGRMPRDPSKAPSLVAPRRKAGPPYLLGVVGPGDTEDKSDNNGFDDDRLSSADAPPPVPPIADYFKQAPLSPGLISLRSTARSDRGAAGANGSISGSVTSAGGNTTKTAGGYVDLLDAQGAFKPSDFKTRVKASGVRDYGEDVADRNMGVNGVDLNSPAVMAFYALTGGEALVYKSDGSAMDVHGNRYTPGNIPSHLRSESGVGQDENVARANQSMRVPRFPTRTTSLEPREELTRVLSRGQSNKTLDDKSGAMGGRSDTAAARRRMSVHGSALTSSTPQPKARPLSMHPIGFSDFKSDEEAASVPDIPRTRAIPNGEASDNRSPRTQSRARDSVLVTKKQQDSSSSTRPRSRSTKSTRSNTKLKHHDTDSEESEATGRPRSRSSATKRRKGKARADESSLSSYILGGDDAIPPLPSSALSSSRPGSSGRHDSRPPSQRSWKASSIGQLSTTSTTTAPHTDAANQSNSRPSSSSSHPRNRSIGGSSAHGRTLHDITEYIPNRRSSLSISSIPSSSLSSNPFPSSQSRHTADTSLDLGYSLPMKPDTTPSSDRRGHFRGKGSNITVASSIRTGGYHDQRADAPSMYQHQDASAAPTVDNYDDDMTTTTDGSDIDSYLEKRRRKRPDDEGLLFREGAYGTAGSGLPGLFSDEEIDGNGLLSNNTRGAAPAPMWPASLRHPPSKSVTSRPRTAGSSLLSSNAPPPIPSWDYNLPKLPKASIGSSKYHYHPHADHDDSSSITVSESEAGRISQAGSLVYANETGILSGSSVYDETEKEMDDQLELKLAIRLRREMKRRERALTTSAARPKSVESPRTWEKYEQGNMADAEV